MSTHEKLPGIVLKTHAVRESDLMATVLTKTRGKLTAIAKGARRSKRRFLGGVDIFDCGVLEISTLKNNDSLFMLHGISERKIWANLRNDLTSFSLSCLLVELTETFSPEGDIEGGEMFAALYCALRNINETKSPALQIASVVYFTLNLLQHGGIDPMSHPEEIAPELTTWFNEMLQARKAFALKDPTLLLDAISLLLNHAEYTIGRGLKTREEAMLRMQKIVAGRSG